MWRQIALGTVLRLWLAVSLGSCQSGDEPPADLGSGYVMDVLRDQPKEAQSDPHPQPTNQCQVTFVTPRRDACVGKDASPELKEEVAYLQTLLQDSNRVLQSLQYTVKADTQDAGYQEVISENNKGTNEDNKEFYVVLNKVMAELQTHMGDDPSDIPDERKKLQKSVLAMDHLIQSASRLADKLDEASQDLEVLLEKQLERSTNLAYQNTIKS
ncbi:uncharacterized protein LOC128484385 [Spea bombifrons]|uniref:uncharacterized protein LOC128484385 n=1 Tax=Spea bombifrons TaxID=233779 RepID=UPI00234B99BA|nr:uncharacterized protein LOC128484385 [Spea bombifrons]